MGDTGITQQRELPLPGGTTLTSLTFHQVLSVPRAYEEHEEARLSQRPPRAVRAGLIDAHVSGSPVAALWLQQENHSQLGFYLARAQPGGFASETHNLDEASVNGQPQGIRLAFPVGASGRLVPSVSLAETLIKIPSWIRCVGVADALLAAPQPDQPRREGESIFEDAIAYLSGRLFAWLIIAEPCPAGVVDDQLARRRLDISQLVHSDQWLEREQEKARYQELASARIAGTWQVHVLAGSSTSDDARRIAALLAASCDIQEKPYLIIPGDSAQSLAEALAASATPGPGKSPFIATTDLLAALMRPPVRELPGIRAVIPPSFDTTPEHQAQTPAAMGNSVAHIAVGHVLDENGRQAGTLSVPHGTLNRHSFVCGATGAGKSQTIRAILESLHASGIPWLVIEPAKAEYAGMAGRLRNRGEVTVVRPGDAESVPGLLNPLEPEPGFPLQTHIDLVRALFMAAFEAYEPLPQVLSHALTRCYQDLGWDLVLSESRLQGITPRYPVLADLRRTALDVVNDIGYGKEVGDNVRGFIDVRISSLRLGTPGRFFEGGHPIDVGQLLGRNVVLELEDIGNDQDKAFFIGAVLIRIVEHLRGEGLSPALRHITVVEEAHRLLKVVQPGSPAAHAVELFAGLLAEVRAYGEGIIVAEQIPSKVIPDVIKNSALKIVHRLPAYDDRFTVGATMNLNEEQSAYVVSLPPGQAAVFADGMDHPVLTAMPYGEPREDASLASRNVPVKGPRSAACDATCRGRPCTMREMNSGQRLADDPHVTLWIELLTVAHLVGEPEPRPAQHWLATLSEQADRRTLECAVSHRIQAAIDSRYAGLVHHYQPERLAEHLAGCAKRRLDGGTVFCAGSETEWQAGRYRWVDVFRALNGGTPEDPSHPDTPLWSRRGLHLAGTTQASQLAELRRHPDTWLPARTTITGTSSPPTYELAAAKLSNAPEPVDRLADSIGFLRIATKWPEARLYPDEARKKADTP